jgi:trehalose 6-phosphate phosphatase
VSGISFDSADAVASEVRRHLDGRQALVLTDYDGTLAEVTPTPAEAVMTDDMRVEIGRLSAIESVTVGVVSGRRLEDVRARVGPAAEFVAGLHGLEIAGPAEAFRHPALNAVAPAIHELATAAAEELAWCRGVLIEDKTYALTCHVRLVAPDEAGRALEEFVALAEPQLDSGLLRLMPGRKVYELLPAVDWHKGRAMQWIRARVAKRTLSDVVVIYLGDDRTDEDAFTMLGADDLAIGVGPRPHTHLIDWRLSGPAAVARLLARLADL